MIKIDAVTLLNKTAIENKLEQYINQPLMERFTRLIALFNEFGSINENDYHNAELEIKRLIKNRLLLEKDWTDEPQILEQEIEKPFFIIGNVRAGTTFAQSILALDEGHRTPCYWDTRNPTPPAGLDKKSDIQAHQEAEDFINFMLSKSPGLLQAHPYFDQRGYTEAEDEFLYSTDFHNAYPLHFLKVPNLPQCLPPEDPILALRFHKKMLKQLQWKSPVTRWVGKGIIHQYIMPSLLEVFPDAVCFWMHRPPEQYIASLLELLELQYKPFNGNLYHIDPHSMVEQLHQGMSNFISQPSINDKRINHIRFADFIKDPISIVESIYEKNNIPFTKSFEIKINQRITDPSFKADRYGKFEYSLEKFGLTGKEIRNKFSEYCETFNL